MDFEKELNKIMLFFPNGCRQYYDEIEDGYSSFFAVLIKDGKINVTRFPSGRIKYNLLNKGEHILCFKKVVNKTFLEIRKLYLRYELENPNLLEEQDRNLYEYIKNKCLFKEKNN